MPSSPLTTSRRCKPPPTSSVPTSSANASTTDPDPGAEVLSQGAQAAQSVTLLCDRPDRVLPQLHLQAPLPDPQAVRTQLRARPVAADGRQDRRDLRHPRAP